MRIFRLFCVLLIGVVAACTAAGDDRTQPEAKFGQVIDVAGGTRLYRNNEDFYLITDAGAEHRFRKLPPEQRRGMRVPAPPFPNQARPIPEGIGLYEFTFDADGKLTKFNVVQTANVLLDRQTEIYARNQWHGPLNALITLAVAYHKTGQTGSKVYGL